MTAGVTVERSRCRAVGLAQASIIAALSLGGATIIATGAGATTYVGTQDISGGEVDISITTDGTLGYLNTDDITAFDIKITDGAQTADINNINGQEIVGAYGSLPSTPDSNLLATATTLSFEGSDCVGPSCGGGANVIFQEGGVGSGDQFYCLQANACYDYTYEGQGFSTSTYTGGYPGNTNAPAMASVSEAGPFVVASVVSAAPEPGSWTLLLLGTGLVGYTLRHRARLKPGSAVWS